MNRDRHDRDSRLRSSEENRRATITNPEVIFYRHAAEMDEQTKPEIPSEGLSGFHLINVSPFYVVFAHFVFKEAAGDSDDKLGV